jgi:hypothetical protein
MSTAEVVFRATRTVRAAVLLVLPMPGVNVPNVVPSVPMRNFVNVGGSFDISRYQHAADQILRGRYSFFDIQDVYLGCPPTWNRDPLTGISAPLKHALLLDYRDETQVGNIKYLWEPNRHLHFVTLAQAYVLTRDEAYAYEIRLQLESWITQCPYPYGPNWASSLELGIRLINWSITWQLIGGYDAPVFVGQSGEAFRRAWLRAIFLHARHIVRNLSRYSSANNHLIGEAAGVYVASITWPYWARMSNWGDQCKAILCSEALRQNAPDGGNREQAISYQQFVLDFLLISGLAANANGQKLPATYWKRIESMIEFLASLMDVAGNVPMLGDADDGFVVKLAADKIDCPFKSLIATGSLLFDRPDFATKAAILDDKSRWLLPPKYDVAAFGELRRGSTQPYTPRRSFPESGYYLLGSEFETDQEVRMLVDCGPLGYLSLAAHGHADSLAIVLSVGGEEILVDPGTYCYHTAPEWRNYFRGTSAHNTVQVDNYDQSIPQGNFMWSRHASSHCLKFVTDANRQYFVGVHEGYKRLRNPVVHRREITYFPNREEFEIEDILFGSGPHDVTRHWHLAEHLVPKVDRGVITIESASAHIIITAADDHCEQELAIGSIDPIGGWISRCFGSKIPSHTVRWRNRMLDNMILKTRISILR